MDVLDHEPHWWYLLQDGDALLLDVHCSNGPVDYDWTMVLNDGEVAQYRAAGLAFINSLAEKVQWTAPGARGSSSPYLGRNLDASARQQVSAAVMNWRKDHATQLSGRGSPGFGSKMREYLFNIAERFQISGRGVVFASDVKIAQIPRMVRPGQVFEFCPPANEAFQSRVTSVELPSPFSPYRSLGFMVEPSVQAEQVPVGTAVWLVGERPA
jgi:hypothetical protein